MIHIAILTTGDDRSSERYSSAVAYELREGYNFEAEWKQHLKKLWEEVLASDSLEDRPDNFADEIIDRMINEGWVFPESDCLEVEYD